MLAIAWKRTRERTYTLLADYLLEKNNYIDLKKVVEDSGSSTGKH